MIALLFAVSTLAAYPITVPQVPPIKENCTSYTDNSGKVPTQYQVCCLSPLLPTSKDGSWICK